MRKYYESEDYAGKDYTDEEKYLYLLLYAPSSNDEYNVPLRGNTWLQKIMHFLSHGTDGPRYMFKSYALGAFSDDLESLKHQNTVSGLIEQRNKQGSLKLSSTGLKIAEELWMDAPEQRKTTIIAAKKFFYDLSEDELIAYSYSTFPETTPNSEILNKFNDTRISTAVNLFKRQKVSVKKASNIAGLPEEEFISELRKRGISAFHSMHKNFKETVGRIESST